MQDKTQQLLSSQAAKEKLAHHVEQLEKELTSLRLEGRKLQQASSHLPRAEVPQVIQVGHYRHVRIFVAKTKLDKLVQML